jgi:hypothetical protein
MSDISITTNGTVEGTKLTVDGKEITNNEKVIGISLYAMAPYKSKYSGDSYPGSIRVSYEVSNEDGTINCVSLMSGSDSSSAGIGNKITNADQVIQYVGEEAETKISNLADAIMEHCSKNNIPCPSRDILLSRTETSLKDKVMDLGIKIEDGE